MSTLTSLADPPPGTPKMSSDSTDQHGDHEERHDLELRESSEHEQGDDRDEGNRVEERVDDALRGDRRRRRR